MKELPVWFYKCSTCDWQSEYEFKTHQLIQYECCPECTYNVNLDVGYIDVRG